MSSVNKILNSLTHSTKAKPVENLVEELKANNSHFVEVQKEIRKKELAPSQTKDSPYVEDRPFHDPFARKGSDFEADWKKVSSRDEKAQEIYREDNLKKLNIIF